MNYKHIVLQGYWECKPEKTAFGKYFERQAKIAERDEFVEKQDFYGECLSVIKSYQDEVYYQYRKYLTEHDSALAGYRTVLKNGRTKDDKGVAIQTHIDNILQERKGKEQQGYENDTYYFWCGTDGNGKIVNDMFSLEHKLYYPILERMKESINILIISISEQSTQDNDSTPGDSEINLSNWGRNDQTRYEYDPITISRIFEHCQKTDVFDDQISLSDFTMAIDNTDFKEIVEKCAKRKKKSKCMSVINKLSKVISSEWYRKTAHSINTEPTRISGISVPCGWKKELDDIK